MPVAFTHARILTDAGLEDGLALLVEDGRVTAVLDASDPVLGALEITATVDLGGAVLAPGFIDVQVNGGGGTLFNNTPTVEGLRTIAAAHRRFGTTGLLPTLISDSVDALSTALQAMRDALAQGVPGVLGIHLEGPYLAPARKGTHDASTFRVPSADEIALALSLGTGITLMTVAPERLPREVLRAFVEGGAVVCAGHTAATYEQIGDALSDGIRGFTHLFNAMSPLEGRAPGVVGAALADRDTWCGIIVDGHHVHPGSVRAALAAKARGKVLLVTDAMPPVGADDPSYELYGETITAVDGICRNAAGALAGSALDMATAVRNSVRLVGVPLEEALRMASTYPAEFLGIDRSHGRIAAGCAADFVLLDDDVRVLGTWIAGEGGFHGTDGRPAAHG